MFKEKGLAIAQDIAYSANSTDVQSQVLQLKEKKPDVVIMITYTSDAILYAKTMQALDYKPPMMIADNAGYSDPSFLKAVGKISQGIFNRSSWSVGPPGSPTFLINEMYKKKSGGDDLDDTAARQMQGFFVLVRCDRPRRLDRTRQDPGGAEGDRPQARSADHGLQGRQVRRQGPEHAGRRPRHPVAGRRELRPGLAEGQRPRRRRSLPYKGW